MTANTLEAPVPLPVLVAPVALGWAPPKRHRSRWPLLALALLGVLGAAAIVPSGVVSAIVSGRLRRELPAALEAATGAEHLSVSWRSCSVSLSDREVLLEEVAIQDSSGHDAISARRVRVRATREALEGQALDFEDVELEGVRGRVCLWPDEPPPGSAKPFHLMRVSVRDLDVEVCDPQAHALRFAIDRADLGEISGEPAARGVPISASFHGAVLDLSGQRLLGGGCEGDVSFEAGKVAHAHGQVTFEDSQAAGLGGGSLTFTRKDEGTARTVAHVETSLLGPTSETLGTLVGTATLTPALGEPCENRDCAIELKSAHPSEQSSMTMNMSTSLSPNAGNLKVHELLAGGFARLPGLVAAAKEQLDSAKAKLHEVKEEVKEELHKLGQ